MGREAIVVGAGPNGLTAALVLARAGWQVRVVEADGRPGGGVRTEDLTLPGFAHDVCSAVHPTGIASPAFADLAIDWVQPSSPVAHPLDGGRAAIVERDLDATAERLGEDGAAYRKLMHRFVESAPSIMDVLLGGRHVPRPTVALTEYATVGLRSAASLARGRFITDEARGLFAGLAAHAILPLDRSLTGGVALMFALLAHAVGWPVVRGGSQGIATSLVAELESHGGEVVTDTRVTALGELGAADVVLLDLTPAQVLAVAGDRLPKRYRKALHRYRYGPGVCKVDYALSEPIPWTNPEVLRAATVHVGGTLPEVMEAEAAPHDGKHAERPFVLLVQPTLADPTRAPEGKHVGWAYCHVPSGSNVDCTPAIEAQIERFAPGFRDVVLDRHVLTAADVERRDPNRVGGDIAGGVTDFRQLLARPILSATPWATPVKGLYLCSSATPPGGGVHGMCGWHAAHAVLRAHRD